MATAGLMVAIAPHHALGVELQYAARSASYNDTQMAAFDPAAQLRVMYAITSDNAFGGGN